ncbi:properdin-like [Bufo gargarizans]|uniref:properdin-like n=1 Tax=Bufo gargarizans TaxID=30331 RepID=UPI001CF15209|nr:properdin-like [Bufo gargarizans]XP_044124365.1 properdin-like [Bufo gargarizans]
MSPLPFFLLIVVSIPSAGAYDVLCFTVFNDTSLQCEDFLGDGILQEDCCLNHKYGFKRELNLKCQSCRPSEWSEWGNWSPCSVTCHEGFQERHRTCIGQGHCPGNDLEVKSCVQQECCPVMGGWSKWTSWSRCSVTCGIGHKQKSRLCDNPKPSCGGTCIGVSNQIDFCETHQLCPTHGSWGNWGPWNPCSSHCKKEGSTNIPIQLRYRVCDNPRPSIYPAGNPCQGSAHEDRQCSDLPFCPVDGGWGSWKKDSQCTVTCGVGRIREKRTCDNPLPRYGGQDCAGSPTRDTICNTKIPCPIDGQWSNWQEWSPCGLLQGETRCQKRYGLQNRHRECLGTSNGGKWCEGKYRESRKCYNVDGCDLNGAWSAWTEWGLCSSPCGLSEKKRFRECLPQYTEYSGLEEAAFSGTPKVRCASINGETLKVEEKMTCPNLPPCQ